MRSIEDKKCVINNNNAAHQEMSLDFHNRSSSALGKPTPSKWDDAQKWLSRGADPKASPRNSNADDRRLIAPPPLVPKKDYDQFETDDETKNVVRDYQPEEDEETVWRINKPAKKKNINVVRSICVRDMGTEMTPIASQEPSRTATPIRATTPAVGSPMSSGDDEGPTKAAGDDEKRQEHQTRNNNGVIVNKQKKLSPLESRAAAWDEAERAKYTARYKREEVKIQAWENHQKRKAEMEMRKVEVKAERLKSRAQEKYTNTLASTRRIAEEKRANAEAKLNEKAVKTSETADYIRRTGHLPSSFSFKLPSFWS